MDMRLLGRSGLRVSAISYGVMTFGGVGGFRNVGTSGVDEARTMIDMCLDAGVNLFDSADMYSSGASEEILGQAMQGKRDKMVVATKLFFRMGDGPNDLGLSRAHIVKSCEASLRRMNTDYIDLYQSHAFDALTPLDETLEAFETLIRDGKVRYVGCSNHSGWHLMKALAASETPGRARYVSQQIYYSLVGREAEFELVPLGLDQGVGILVWSPLAAGLLTGKYQRDAAPPQGARRAQGGDPDIMLPPGQEYDVIEALGRIAQERNVSVAQVALNWLLRKPGVTSAVVGARTPAQLTDNLAAAQWHLTDDETRLLDEASAPPVPYPYWHQRKYATERQPVRPPFV